MPSAILDVVSGISLGGWHDLLSFGLSIVTWEASDVLKIPGSATFRDRDGWSVFVMEKGRALRRTVQIGHRNQAEAEIMGGISAGEQVIPYPSNLLHDGDRVRTR
jgi:HlyD family secretion protein